MSKLRLAILASGRGSNFEAIYQGILAEGINAEIVLVFSDNHDAPVLKKAEGYGLATATMSPKRYDSRQIYDRELAELVASYQPDLIILAGYMLLLTEDFIDRFPAKILNIHPALLPSFPGLHAQQQALDAGVKVTGCTIHFVDKGMDTGPIIAQRVVCVTNDEDEATLSAKIREEEHKLYIQVIHWMTEDKVILIGNKTKIVDQ